MQIGRLVKQSIRSIWTAEDRDFTPWLAQQDNLDLLAETLGVGSLQQIYEEVAVGSFRADIVCEDLDGSKVVIENQFETSDHRHLGQILTYLVGAEARTVVWIAERIREEHRAVIDWLNESTPLEYAFFGVELEVWRIGDSVPAPRFEVVARPNDWVRRQKERNRATEMEDYQGRMAFWGAMLDRVPSDFALDVPARAPNQGWMKFSLSGEDALSGCGIYCYRMLGENRVGVYLSLGRQDPERSAEWLAGIAGYRLVDGAARTPATGAGWEINRSQRLQFFVTLDADAMDETDWPRQHDWMISQASTILQDWRSGLRADVMRLIDAS